MQICALDHQNELIFASDAVKHLDYQCIECKEPVRLRSGLHRQAHYYHLRPNGACRLHSKGMPHLMLQYYLKDFLPAGEVDLECRFDSINRIADVAWHPQRLIFEIQCSPITPLEIIQRNADYFSAGYRVIWILHDARYNRYRLSAAETALASHPHYYTNMNALGEGKIYDQFAIVEKGRRTVRLEPLEIDPSIPKNYQDEITKEKKRGTLPLPLFKRAETWQVSLAGDTLHRFLDHCGAITSSVPFHPKLKEQFDLLALKYRHSYSKDLVNLFRKVYLRCLAIPYRSLLKLILERACR